ncbi:uncharacterized protein V1518DRAFT_427528 [Limtongia smithiae]|uniref:uncharacterized protein n=1 Tax=Limtongia smithiae TaxID=1125753 RepID=UPI0034CD1BCC
MSFSPPSPSLASSFATTTSTTTTPLQRARSLYKKSRRLFLTHQFADANAALSPLVSETSTLYSTICATPALRDRVWRLYLALLDGILGLTAKDVTAGGLFGKAEVERVRGLVQNAGVWELVLRAYAGDARRMTMPSDMVITVSTLCIRHHNPDIMRTKLDRYIGDNNLLALSDAESTKILEHYAMRVLPACGLWDDARIFLEEHNVSSPERTTEELLLALEKLRTEDAAKRKQAESLTTSKAAQKAAAKRKQRTKGHSVATTVGAASMSQNSSPEEDNLPSPLTRHSPARPVPPSKGDRPFTSHLASLINMWRVLIAAGSRRPELLARLIEIILALVLLIPALVVPETRKRLTAVLGSLWEHMRRTLAMAVRVSYV